MELHVSTAKKCLLSGQKNLLATTLNIYDKKSRTLYTNESVVLQVHVLIIFINNMTAIQLNLYAFCFRQTIKTYMMQQHQTVAWIPSEWQWKISAKYGNTLL